MDTATLAPAPKATSQAPAGTRTDAGTGARADAAAPDLGGIKPLPVWFFAFEGLMSAAFDLYRAYPQALGLIVAAGLVNLVVSLTVLRSRVRLAKRLWRGKRTRKLALGLVALRIACHSALAAVGLGVVSAAGHLAFAAVMGVTTVTLLWFVQRTALRAVAADAARTA
ncbi:hypothetical protein M1P56_03815 [Streptomyces sp. HU2014]|uniref:hypothetical protein n=1 Tax=Streptomyces sp. HU2014 TaxID=2939414 RepID=UPI00200E0490|nr:hypothetical protein [Streptomyces sp. HU2014]UQI43557.1 hypothetical protein M1P56_03815 [Streptomyces sp. HU2014]